MMPRRLLVSILVSLVTALAGAQGSPTSPAQAPPSGQSQTLTKEQREEILKGISEIVVDRAFAVGVDQSKWPEYVAKHREEIDKAETEVAFAREVNRALREFGLSHLRLRTPRAAQTRRDGPSAVGLGIRAEAESNAGLRVTAVLPNSPGAAAGLEPGDLIVKVDGSPASSMESLNGEENSKAKLDIKKKDGAEKSVEVTRARFSPVVPDGLSWQGPEAAVLRIRSFSRTYQREKIEEMLAEASKAKYLVLDLRSNGGGLASNLHHLLGLLLPPDTAYGTMIGRRTVQQYVEATKKEPNDPVAIAAWAPNKRRTQKGRVEPFQGKIAVLINRGSGSASEMVAAALKELAGAPLIGSRTAGAVLSSTFGRLPHGFEIQYPVSDYVTVRGLRLEGNPLQPDVEVATGEGADAAIEKALEKLRSGESVLPLAA